MGESYMIHRFAFANENECGS